MEAARTAAIRGCKVTIYEATDIIGGTFGRIASPSFKKRIRELIKWYGVQLDKLGVDIKLNTKVGLDDPCLVNADEIFVRMKEKQLHGEELTKEDLKRAVKDEAYRKKLLEELNSQD